MSTYQHAGPNDGTFIVYEQGRSAFHDHTRLGVGQGRHITMAHLPRTELAAATRAILRSGGVHPLDPTEITSPVDIEARAEQFERVALFYLSEARDLREYAVERAAEEEAETERTAAVLYAVAHGNTGTVNAKNVFDEDPDIRRTWMDVARAAKDLNTDIPF